MSKKKDLKKLLIGLIISLMAFIIIMTFFGDKNSSGNNQIVVIGIVAFISSIFYAIKLLVVIFSKDDL